MLPLPPAGQRIKTTLQFVALTSEPMRIAEHDEGRLFLILFIDEINSTAFSIARAPSQMNAAASFNGYSLGPAVIYGPEELWAQRSTADAGVPVGIFVHQIFRD